MHYKQKRTAKAKSQGFYLPEILLKQLGIIGQIEKQSRGVIVEVCFNNYAAKLKKGGNNALFAKIKRKFYKRKRKQRGRAKRA